MSPRDPAPAFVAPSDVHAASGNWNADWESFARLDPDWTERMVSASLAPAVSGALDAKTIELVQIALCASIAQLNEPGVRRHVRRALDRGASREEIVAVLQVTALQGLQSMALAAPVLLDELACRPDAA
jgi:AhpD family alkylhydroperoxidase